MPSQPLKVIFFGTPDLSVPFLEALTNKSDFQVVGVVTQPDRPVGRKQILTPSPVKNLATAKDIAIFQPETLKDEEVQKKIAALGADVFIVVAYGLMIPGKVLNMSELGCVNVHPSLLPKYRGPSPIQSAIANGDERTGISIMLLDKGMDTGPLLSQEEINLAGDENQTSLIEKIKQLGPEFLIKTLRSYSAGEIKPEPQDETRAEICKLLNRDSGRIDWSRPAIEIDRQIRAYQPWPGSWTVWNRDGKEMRVKILKAKLSKEPSNENPGAIKIDGDRLVCETSNGGLEITELQPEGRPAMTAGEFIRGYRDTEGRSSSQRFERL